jgi:hypothetical protein
VVIDIRESSFKFSSSNDGSRATSRPVPQLLEKSHAIVARCFLGFVDDLFSSLLFCSLFGFEDFASKILKEHLEDHSSKVIIVSFTIVTSLEHKQPRL